MDRFSIEDERFGRVSFELPDDAEPVEDLGGDDLGWMTSDGLFIALRTAPAEESEALDPLSVDLHLGAALAHYEAHQGGKVSHLMKHEVPGTVGASLARLALIGEFGEPLELVLVSWLTPDRQVVTLQVAWAAAVAEHMAAAGIAVIDSLSTL